jgi:hypothetical protein
MLTVLTQKPALLSDNCDESYSDDGLVICGVLRQPYLSPLRNTENRSATVCDETLKAAHTNAGQSAALVAGKKVVPAQ